MERMYYVNVQSRTVNVVRDANALEWEIVADRYDIEQLQELFEDLQDADEEPLSQFLQLGIGSDTQENEMRYESILKQIYRFIDRHASEETRKQLEQTGVLMV